MTIDFDNAFSGVAQLMVTGKSSCGLGPASDAAYIIVTACASIREEETSQGIEIYPNPSSGMISISRLNETINHYDVLNSLGEIIYSGILHSNVEHYVFKHSGVYFIRFRSSTNVILKRVVIN